MIPSGTRINVGSAKSFGKPKDGFVEIRIEQGSPYRPDQADAQLLYALLRDWLPATTFDALADLFEKDLPTWAVVEVKADGTVTPKLDSLSGGGEFHA